MGFSTTVVGQRIFAITTNWVYQRMRGPQGALDHVLGLKDLEDFGITRDNAVAELKPRFPEAHLVYNTGLFSSKQYASWEEWWDRPKGGYLQNRIANWFFCRDGGKIVGKSVVFGEWPGGLPFQPLPMPPNEPPFCIVPTELVKPLVGTPRLFDRDMVRKMWELQGRRCMNCLEVFEQFEDVHGDHILAHTHGGSAIWENLQVLCVGCNLAKGSMSNTIFRIQSERKRNAKRLALMRMEQ
jgi:hypothetical protein